MPIVAIIPVKTLHDSKRRLAHLLSAGERAGLIGRFLDNLLLTLDATPGIDRTLVVTCDPAVVRLARRRGADVLLEPAADGLNAAAERGMAHAAAQGATAVLLLPADLPFVRVEDIEAMLRPLGEGRGETQRERRDAEEENEVSSSAPLRVPLRFSASLFSSLVVVCPDETEDGTNALLLAPPGDFTFRYGPGSFRAHLAEAARRGRPAHVVPAPGLRFDLDTESDWLVYNGYLVGVGEE